jgi:hypothetical protein
MATSLGHSRDIGARPQYKEGEGFFLRPAETTWALRPEDWRGKVPSRKACQTPLSSVS